MKVQLTLLVLLAFAVPSHAQPKDQVLNDGVKFAHALWSEVLGKPKLEYQKIAPDKAETQLGTWKGACMGPWSNPQLTLTLKKDHSRSASVSSPDMEPDEVADNRSTGKWYLKDGMILLFNSPVEKDAEFDADKFRAPIIMKKEHLRLLDVLMRRGFVELTKQGNK